MDALYHHLQGVADPAVDRAMAAALPSADPAAIRRMAPLLLERAHHEGTLGLVMHYHQLPPDVQRQVVEHVHRLFRPLREAAGRRQGHGPANVITLVQQSRNTRLAYLVSEQLRHGSDTLHAAAGACLLQLAELAASDPKPERLPTLDADAAAFLQDAIIEAVEHFARHRESAVLLALAWLLPRPVAAAMPPMTDAKSPAGAAMSTLLRRADHPAARRALLPMLALPAQTDAAIDGLRRCGEAGLLADVLVHHHLLLLPAVRRPLTRIKQVDGLWSDADQRRDMEPAALRGLPVWLDALPAESAQRLAYLASLGQAADAGVRLAALRRLVAMASDKAVNATVRDEATTRIVEYCHDLEPALARIALRHLVATRYAQLPRLLTRLVSSPHESLRRMAGEQLGPLAFTRLWAMWNKLEPDRRRAAAQALMKIDPHFHRMLGNKLKQPDRSVRLQAMSMIEQLNQGAFFEAALKQYTDDADERVAASAVRALGSAEGDDARAAVTHALDHPDSRVRANAIEALEQAGDAEDVAHLHRLLTMADREDAGRPRANAIHALLRSRTNEALHALTDMLHDDRAEHRASALWLVKDMGLLSLARMVAELSLRDPDEAIRQRADGVIRDLVERLAIEPDPTSDDPSSQSGPAPPADHDPHAGPPESKPTDESTASQKQASTG